MMLVKHSHRKHFIDDSAHDKEKKSCENCDWVLVASHNAIEKLEAEVDEVISVFVPEQFYGVGAFYEDFEQVNDEEVIYYLQKLIKEMRKAS